MAAVSSTLQLLQNVCASELFSPHVRPQVSGILDSASPGLQGIKSELLRAGARPGS